MIQLRVRSVFKLICLCLILKLVTASTPPTTATIPRVAEGGPKAEVGGLNTQILGFLQSLVSSMDELKANMTTFRQDLNEIKQLQLDQMTRENSEFDDEKNIATINLSDDGKSLSIKPISSQHPIMLNSTDNFKSVTMNFVLGLQESNELELNPSPSSAYEKQSEQMWMLWLSPTVPVIGTSKNVVELATAFLLRDNHTAFSICREMKLDPGLFYDGDYSALTIKNMADSAGKSGALVGITESKLTELLSSANIGKRGRTAVQGTFANLTTESKQIGPTNKRADRGEHVINNGVIGLNQNIVEQLLKSTQVTYQTTKITVTELSQLSGLPTGRRSIIRSNCEFPFNDYTSTTVKTNIEQNLIVHIPVSTVYINANAFIYGHSIQLLRKFAIEHMKELNSTKGQHHSTNVSIRLKESVRQIVKHLLFVDPVARNLYLKNFNPPSRYEKFCKGHCLYYRARNSTIVMLQGLHERLGLWMSELKRSGYLFFN